MLELLDPPHNLHVLGARALHNRDWQVPRGTDQAVSTPHQIFDRSDSGREIPLWTCRWMISSAHWMH